MTDPARSGENGQDQPASPQHEEQPSQGTGARGSAHKQEQQTLLEQMGGISGLFYSSLPVVVFVLANAIFGLTVGIWSALGSAVLITLLRVVRKEPVQPAISGFFGVAIAAFIAYKTGSAKGYFLLGIWASAAYCAAMVVSVLVRWPAAGLVWNYLNGAGTRWRADKPSRMYYDVATLALAAVFAARFVVQEWLYSEDLTGWLAVAKIGMGYPLYGLALLVVVWAVRKSDRRLRELDRQRESSDAEIEADLRARYS